MAIEEGYALFACDRSDAVHGGKPREEHLSAEDERRNEWHQEAYTDEHGVTINYTLCPECWEKHQSMKVTWDRDFREFLQEGY